MKNKCKFVGIMFLCILIVCTFAVMAYEHAYEHTAGKTGVAGEMSDASDSAKNTDEADDMLTVVTSFYPMYIATFQQICTGRLLFRPDAGFPASYHTISMKNFQCPVPSF